VKIGALTGRVNCGSLLRLLRRSCPAQRRVGHEYDLAGHSSLAQQLVRLSSFGKRKSLRDERFDLLLLKQVQERDQILSKQSWPQPFERLDTVRDNSFPAWQKRAAGNVPDEDTDFTKAMPATGTT